MVRIVPTFFQRLRFLFMKRHWKEVQPLFAAFNRKLVEVRMHIKAEGGEVSQNDRLSTSPEKTARRFIELYHNIIKYFVVSSLLQAHRSLATTLVWKTTGTTARITFSCVISTWKTFKSPKLIVFKTAPPAM